MSDPVRELVKAHLKQLRLPAMARELERLSREAAASDMNYEQFLLRLAEAELAARSANALETRIKNAAFPVAKDFDTYDFAAMPTLSRPKIPELAICEWIDQKFNCCFIGNTGTGKTHLAIALGTAACGQGQRVRFWRVTELITALREADDDRHLLRLRGHLAKLDLLVLDELGYVPASKAGAELLFDVIATAYERTSVVLTTNLPFENWTEVLGSDRLTGAALDRLTHRCHIVELAGESYRLQDAKRRRRADGKT